MSSDRNMQPTPLLVLGAGSWGTALAVIAAGSGRGVRLWGHRPAHMQELAQARINAAYLPEAPFPGSLEIYSDLAVALNGVEDVLMAVPSAAFQALLSQLPPGLRIAWGCKGLTAEHLFCHEAVLRRFGKAQSMAVLSGPSIAHEVIHDLPTALVLASNDADFAQTLIQNFSSKHLGIQFSVDILGVEIGGALKNVIALASGLMSELRWGDNAEAALVTQGLAEMMRLGTALGAQPKTFLGLSGLGDLVLTCTSPKTRSRRFGKLIAQGKTADEAEKIIGQAVEARHNALQFYQLAQQYRIRLPIVECVYQVLTGEVQTEKALRGLFATVLGN